MFGIPGKQAVTLTPKATTQVRKLMESKGHAGLRIGVKKGGCAGMEYTMDYVDTPDPNDEVVEQDGAVVMIAPMAQMFLFGTEIDYQTSLLESGFHFNNPNVADACGCGESIKFKDVEELATEHANGAPNLKA
ncbi:MULTISPECIES: HesB/IscA family protein [Marivita]|jgi:iron-sulfur cluster assembly protein|uniref:Iron-sulfur cluster assembly accessory protein n=1 Tax=Marivita cryptomonadis TaxID=505252 RepID=A0A9Q2NZ39_9RHOB|nr:MULTISPECIES: iron-sulfur cluster assembly accessory protein [Marivita]MCR9168910.1 iron-sulfur cluster assembly accessory protein [Paracoccaceae bacterium]MBM2322452.1 iron-sulfur cluster assembly accessory protein [Marivita cryptomonadis]MBM2332034.1 iron-sulfur cluster assembly accessory protein [Marivita cryptomonadis]MBM2341618.1 iron-sulfur cluster assembly accessory protein [Marivita cryptomonadis]MBM2346282.1 iron-sulfur cluster assembly accessory protein [Marivita cryptomonadis]